MSISHIDQPCSLCFSPYQVQTISHTISLCFCVSALFLFLHPRFCQYEAEVACEAHRYVYFGPQCLNIFFKCISLQAEMYIALGRNVLFNLSQTPPPTNLPVYTWSNLYFHFVALKLAKLGFTAKHSSHFLLNISSYLCFLEKVQFLNYLTLKPKHCCKHTWIK